MSISAEPEPVEMSMPPAEATSWMALAVPEEVCNERAAVLLTSKVEPSWSKAPSRSRVPSTSRMSWTHKSLSPAAVEAVPESAKAL